MPSHEWYVKRAFRGIFKNPGQTMVTDNYDPGGELHLNRLRTMGQRGAYWRRGQSTEEQYALYLDNGKGVGILAGVFNTREEAETALRASKTRGSIFTTSQLQKMKR